jgi:hypothetical protein
VARAVDIGDVPFHGAGSFDAASAETPEFAEAAKVAKVAMAAK